MCNQIELHPYNVQKDLVNWLLKENIQAVAYQPLGNPKMSSNFEMKSCFDDKLMDELSEKYKKSKAQIMLNWGLKRGHLLIVKSNCVDRIKENLLSQDFSLEQEDVNRISQLDRQLRITELRRTNKKEDGYFFPVFS